MSSAAVLNLQAARHSSRVLDAFLASRPGAVERSGVQPQAHSVPPISGSNAVTTNLTAQELASLFSLQGLSSAGVAVTPESALRVATVYACVDRIAGAIKSLPFRVFERLGEASQRADHEYNWLFNERACADWSSADAWAYIIASKLLWGDGYAELLRPSFSASRISGWQPIHPMACQPFRSERTGEKLHRVTRPDGTQDVLSSADVVQFSSLGYDGLSSLSPITHAAQEAVGAAIAGQRWSGRFFKEGATFDYALHTEAHLKPEQLADLRDSLTARMAGSRAPLVLYGGLKPAQLTVNPKDAELLSTRIFSVEEICRIFGVPPHMVGHTEKSTSWGSGVEAQGTNFVRYTLMPHLVQIAQEFNHKLWPSRSRYFVEHVTAALERGDLKSRAESHRVALGRAGEPGWLTINEVRRLENLPPVEGGDQLSQGAPHAQSTDPAAG